MTAPLRAGLTAFWICWLFCTTTVHWDASATTGAKALLSAMTTLAAVSTIIAPNNANSL